MLGHNLSRLLQVQPATCAPSFWRPDPSAVSFDPPRENVDDEARKIPTRLSLLNRTKEARFNLSFACLKPRMAYGLLQRQPAERQIDDARHRILRDIMKHWPMGRFPSSWLGDVESPGSQWKNANYVQFGLIAVRVNVSTPYECSHIPYEENPIVRAAISVQDQARLLVFISERLFALSLSPKTINRNEYNSFPLTKRY